MAILSQKTRSFLLLFLSSSSPFFFFSQVREVTPLLLHLALQFYFQLLYQSWEGQIVRDERETRSYRTPIKFKKGKQEARIHTGRKMNFGRNWPECPERAEMGRNLIRGEMEGIIIPVYTPVWDIPAGTERNS